MGFRMKHIFESISSTNQYMKDHIDAFEHGDVVVARKQTKGKGRHDHIWISPKGNIYISFLLKDDKVYHTFDLVMRTSIAIVTLLEELQCDSWIKYPNDIMVQNKKIAGILIEQRHNIDTPFSIIGCGLNVNQGVFPTLQSKATSLLIETKQQYDLDSIIKELCNIMEQAFKQSKEDILSLYNTRLYLPKKIMYENKVYHVNHLNMSGELILRDGMKEQVVSMDAITLEDTYGAYNT